MKEQYIRKYTDTNEKREKLYKELIEEFTRYPIEWGESNHNPDNKIVGAEVEWEELIKKTDEEQKKKWKKEQE